MYSSHRRPDGPALRCPLPGDRRHKLDWSLFLLHRHRNCWTGNPATSRLINVRHDGALSICLPTTMMKSPGKANWLVVTAWYHVISTNQTSLRIGLTMVTRGTNRKCPWYLWLYGSYYRPGSVSLRKMLSENLSVSRLKSYLGQHSTNMGVNESFISWWMNTKFDVIDWQFYQTFVTEDLRTLWSTVHICFVTLSWDLYWMNWFYDIIV